jgi:hypothetical protein
MGSGIPNHSPESLLKAFNDAIETIDTDETLVWIPGFEDYYAVTDKGKVFSFNQRMGQLKLKLNHAGYPILGNILKSKDGKNRSSVLVNRLVAEAFIPNPKKLPFVNHKNGIKTDNHVSNLEWCTPQENVAHAVLMGLSPDNTGVKNPRAKVTEKEVIEIRKKHHVLNVENSILSKEYNLSINTIKAITRGRNWPHIPMPNSRYNKHKEKNNEGNLQKFR